MPSTAARASFLLPWFIVLLIPGEGDRAFLCAQGDSFRFMIQRREKSHTLIYCIPLCSSQHRSNSLKSFEVHVFAPAFIFISFIYHAVSCCVQKRIMSSRTRSRSWPSKGGTASKVCPKKVRTEVLPGKGSSRCYNATRTAFEPDNHHQPPQPSLPVTGTETRPRQNKAPPPPAVGVHDSRQAVCWCSAGQRACHRDG